jgi:probable rRNA maturation factor
VEAARTVLEYSRFRSAEISLAVVDDRAIHELNRRYLEHDWPTDVLSFALHETSDHLAGEVIVSADRAAAMAAEYGISSAAEQLLYVIHGMLHLVGYRDTTVSEVREMRAAEAKFLRQFGFELPPGFANNAANTRQSTNRPLRRGAKAR